MAKEDNGKRLLEIKEKIDQAKRKADRLRGTQEQLETQLKQHGCKTVAEAKKRLSQIDAELNKSEKELEVGLEKLEKDYAWN